MKLLKLSKRGLTGFLLATLLGGLTAGCSGHPVEKKLAGRWHGESVENFDDDDVAAATGWAKGTSMEFAGSTITVSIPAEEPRSGVYKVVKVNRSDVQLAIQREDGSNDLANLVLDDERSMRWMLRGGRSVVMRRE